MQPSRTLLGAGLLVVLLFSACDRPPSALSSDSPDRPLLTQMDTARLVVSRQRQELIAALEEQLQIAEEKLAADPTDPHQQTIVELVRERLAQARDTSDMAERIEAVQRQLTEAQDSAAQRTLRREHEIVEGTGR
jgi:hypothetical protein